MGLKAGKWQDMPKDVNKDELTRFVTGSVKKAGESSEAIVPI